MLLDEIVWTIQGRLQCWIIQSQEKLSVDISAPNLYHIWDARFTPTLAMVAQKNKTFGFCLITIQI